MMSQEYKEGESDITTTEESASQEASTPTDGEHSVAGQEGGERQAKVEVLSHSEIMHVVKDTLAGLISNDPLLKDLHPYATLEEVNSMIALEYGQAMVVNVVRADADVMPIVVKQEASVLDLKHGIKRFMTLHVTRRAEGPVNISWRYIWKHNWLYFNGEKLTNDNKLLKEYGIRNRDEVTFMKRLQER